MLKQMANHSGLMGQIWLVIAGGSGRKSHLQSPAEGIEAKDKKSKPSMSTAMCVACRGPAKKDCCTSCHGTCACHLLHSNYATMLE